MPNLSYEQFLHWFAQAMSLYHMPQPPSHQSSSAHTDSLPRGVKPPPIEPFDGRMTKLVRPWITRTRGILSLSGFDLNSTKAVVYAASFLTGQAQSWFQGEKERQGPNSDQDNGGFLTFDQFASALAQRLGDPNPDDKARKDIRRLRQTTSVKAYGDEFQRIITYLPGRDPADLRFDFINGLKPKIQELLVGKTHDHMSWLDVRDLAYRYDDVIMSNRDTGTNRFSHSPRPYRDNRSDDPMQLGNITQGYRPSTPGSRSPGSTSLPKLTPALRAELLANNGCFRCRKHNAGHFAHNCPGPTDTRSRSQSPATTHGRSQSPVPKN